MFGKLALNADYVIVAMATTMTASNQNKKEVDTGGYTHPLRALHLNYYDYILYDEPIYLCYAVRFILLAQQMQLNKRIKFLC